MDGWMDGCVSSVAQEILSLGKNNDRFGHPNIRTCCLALGSEALGMIWIIIIIILSLSHLKEEGRKEGKKSTKNDSEWFLRYKTKKQTKFLLPLLHTSKQELQSFFLPPPHPPTLKNPTTHLMDGYCHQILLQALGTISCQSMYPKETHHPPFPPGTFSSNDFSEQFSEQFHLLSECDSAH